MDDAVARYRAATEAGDLEATMKTLAAEAELVSPISGRLIFRGHEDLRVLHAAIYGSLRALRWRDEVGDRSLRVILGEARVGPVRLEDVMALELDPDGRIRRIRPHIRPWLGLTSLALQLGPRLALHPGVIRRAFVVGAGG